MTIERYEPAALDGMTLDELAETIRHEDAEARGAASTALVHAIRVGEALNEAHERVAPGTWGAYVRQCGLFRSDAGIYMRLAIHQEEIREAGVPSFNQAKTFILGKTTGRQKGYEQVTLDVKREALRLRDCGMGYTAIADAIGTSRDSVRRWVDPDYARRRKLLAQDRRRQARKARAALREQEKRDARDKAARQAGGDIAKAYALVRQTAAAVDRAADQATDKAAAGALRSTLSHLYRVEDEVCRIIREQVDQ